MESAIHQHPRSFKAEFSVRPAQYQTPSPPPTEVEPLSPTASIEPRHTWSETSAGKKRKIQETALFLDGTSSSPFQHQDAQIHSPPRYQPSMGLPSLDTRAASFPQNSPSALDVLSTIATSPTVGSEHFASSQRLLSAGMSVPLPNPYTSSFTPSKRGSKRTRSEVIGSRPQTTTESRPTTSHLPPNLPTWRIPATHGYHGSAVPQGLLSSQDHQRHISGMPHPIDHPLAQDAELLLSFTRSVSGKPQSTSQDLNPHPPHTFAEPSTSMCNASEHTLRYSAHARTMPNKSERNEGANYGSLDQTHPEAKDAAAANLSPPFGTREHLVQQAKPREHRGWPKGKPRGPRLGAPDTKRRGKNTVRKGEANGTDRTESRPKQRKTKSTTVQGTGELLSDISEQKQRPRRKSEGEWLDKVYKQGQPAKTPKRQASVPPDCKMIRTQPHLKQRTKSLKQEEKSQFAEVCAACSNSRNATSGTHEFWISCNGCKLWFHTVCAGFDTERRVKEVDKFYCKKCESQHGPTTCKASQWISWRLCVKLTMLT